MSKKKILTIEVYDGHCIIVADGVKKTVKGSAAAFIFAYVIKAIEEDGE